MHLNGDLSDFALADILQILSLGRKTGTLLVENGSVKGRIVIEEGRITGAEAQPGGSLADSFVRRGKIDSDALAHLRRIGTSCPEWDFKSLVLESGLLSESDMQQAAVMHVCTLVARLVDIGKGSFRLLLNETALVNAWENSKLTEGLDIGEVLLQSATESDEEAHRTAELTGKMLTSSVEQPSKKGLFAGASQNGNHHELHKEAMRQAATGATTNGSSSKAGASNGAGSKAGANSGPAEAREPSYLRIERFYALLAELSANSALVEISLLVMRYASEFASRGVLFGVQEGELHGIGQFGVDRFVHGQRIDGLIRGISIPLASDALVARAASERSPFVGHLLHSYWNREMLNAIGGCHDDLQAIAVPLLRNGKAVYVIYADNFGTNEPLIALDELIALTSVTTLALDKTLLEQMVVGAEAR